MTYCLAIRVHSGLVFAADTRTSAGVDDVRTYNKLHHFEVAGQCSFVLLSAGNLATTQAVVNTLKRDWMNPDPATVSLRSFRHMFDAADYVGRISVQAQRDFMATAAHSNVDFRTTLVLGGQIRGEEPSLYLVYPEGNCISTSPETPYLQIGESKYGKPILDRIIRNDTTLEDAARCALVSLDSTMKSNLTVGPPLDLAILPRDTMQVSQKLRLDLDTPFYAQLRRAWGEALEQVFRERLPAFDWEAPRPASDIAPQPAQQQQQLTPPKAITAPPFASG